jgi:hypothetical protein
MNCQTTQSLRRFTVAARRGLRRSVFPALALAFLLCGWATAQNADTASVRGTVRDPQGSVVPKTKITAKNTETGLLRTDTTSVLGTYRLFALPPGAYSITAEVSGFETQVRAGITLAVGADAVIDFAMGLSATHIEVVVSANTAVVETTTATTGANLDRNQIEMLPTISRDYTAFLRVISGTSSTSEGISIFGARGASNNWQVDGVDNTDDATGGQRLSPQLDTVSEFQVLTNSFKAEYGRAAGGVITAISRSGTNAFHGSAYLYYRDENFRAYSPFEDSSKPKAPFKRMYTGGTFGGPIVKNKIFFFLGYERLRQDQNSTATWALPATQPDFSTKTLTFFQMYNIKPSWFSGGQQYFTQAQPLTTHLPSLRLDADLGHGQTITARYQYYQSNQTADLTGSIFDLSATQGWSQKNGININHKWIVSPTTLNEFYVQYSRDLFSSRNTFDMPLLSIQSAGITLGGSANYPQAGTNNRLQLKENFLWTRRNHEIKIGAEVKWAPDTAVVSNLFKGMYVFPFLTNPAPSPAIPSLVNGVPAALVQQVGNPSLPLHDTMMAGFVQDDWRVAPKLRLSLGLRYDYQISKIPALGASSYNYGGLLPLNGAEDPAISRDKNNFAPRFGFTFAPTDSQAIYGGTGVFYDQVIINNFISALFTPPYRAIYQISSPPFPTPVTSFAALSAPGIGFLDPNFHAPYSWNSNLGYRRQISKNMGIDISGVVNRGFSEQMQVNVNPGRTGSATLTGTGYTRLVPTVGAAFKYYNGGHSQYQAFRFELKRRMSKHVSGGIAYTLASSHDNSYNKITSIQVPSDPGLNWGPSDYDIRHNLVSHAEVSLPLGLEFAAIVEAHTARPLNIAGSSYDLNGDGITGDWVNQAICVNINCSGFNYSRNSVRQLSTTAANQLRTLFGLSPISNFAANPNFWNADVTLRKQFKITEHNNISLVFEAFNVFNIYQYSQPVTDFANSLFGQRTSVAQPRTAQLGIHYRF